MRLPTKSGDGIEVVEGSGRCMLLAAEGKACGVRGGGLIRFQRPGKTTIVLCGDHLELALGVIFKAVEAQHGAESDA